MMHLIDGLVDSRPAVGMGGKSAFEVALQALKPIRWYPLDDQATGIARDLGSQKQNGSYGGSSNFNVTPGLVPSRAHCIGLTAPSDPGVSIPAAGLPTGAQPWSIGGVVYVGFRPVQLSKLIAFNGVEIDWGTNAYEVVTPVGAVPFSTTVIQGIFLLAATYDGTTTRFYIYSATGQQIGTASAAQALNLTTGTAFIAAGNGNFNSQDVFFFSTALSAAQLANLAVNIQAVQ